MIAYKCIDCGIGFVALGVVTNDEHICDRCNEIMIQR